MTALNKKNLYVVLNLFQNMVSESKFREEHLKDGENVSLLERQVWFISLIKESLLKHFQKIPSSTYFQQKHNI